MPEQTRDPHQNMSLHELQEGKHVVSCIQRHCRTYSGTAAHTAAQGRGGGSKKKMYRKCIEMYRNVSKCIGSFLVVKVSVGEMYRNVSKCIEMYRNVSGDFWDEPKRIEHFSRIKKPKTAHSKIQLENHDANDDNDYEDEPTNI